MRGCAGRRHLALLAAPAVQAGCFGGAGLTAEESFCSSSVRDGAEGWRGDSDLDAVQRWGLRRSPVFCRERPARGLEGKVRQGLGASCPRPASKRRGPAPLMLLDSLAEGQGELGKSDIV